MYKLVAPTNVEGYWHQVAPYIAVAVGQEASDWEDLDYIRRQLNRNQMQLWLGYSAANEVGLVLVTEAIMEGKRPILVCRWATAENVMDFIPDFGLIEDYAVKHEFHKVRIYGRKGWEKIFKPLGYVHEFTVIGRTLDRGFH